MTGYYKAEDKLPEDVAVVVNVLDVEFDPDDPEAIEIARTGEVKVIRFGNLNQTNELNISHQRISPRKRITEAIRKVLASEDWKDLTPKTINGGNCEEFAVDVANEVKDLGLDHIWLDQFPCYAHEREFWEYHNHCVLQYGGYFFDAESPEGEIQLEDIAFVKRIRAKNL